MRCRRRGGGHDKLYMQVPQVGRAPLLSGARIFGESKLSDSSFRLGEGCLVILSGCASTTGRAQVRHVQQKNSAQVDAHMAVPLSKRLVELDQRVTDCSRA